MQRPSYYPYIIFCISHSLHLAIICILWIEVPRRRGKMYRISYVHKLSSIHSLVTNALQSSLALYEEEVKCDLEERLKTLWVKKN